MELWMMDDHFKPRNHNLAHIKMRKIIYILSWRSVTSNLEGGGGRMRILAYKYIYIKGTKTLVLFIYLSQVLHACNANTKLPHWIIYYW